jgi:hypothetical protein
LSGLGLDPVAEQPHLDLAFWKGDLFDQTFECADQPIPGPTDVNALVWDNHILSATAAGRNAE